MYVGCNYTVNYYFNYCLLQCVNFHPNGMYLATGSSDKTIRVWSASEGKTVRLLVGHTGMIYTVAFSPNGQYIASAGMYNQQRCINKSNTIICSWLNNFKA